MSEACNRRRLFGALAPIVAAPAIVCATAQAGGTTASCPAWVTPAVGAAPVTPATTTPAVTTPVAAPLARSTSLPAISYVSGSTLVGPRGALLVGSLRNGGSTDVTAEYWQKGSQVSCTSVQHASGSHAEFTLSGLQPSTRYRFRLVANDATGASLSPAGTFVTLPTGVIAEGVTIGGTPFGRLARTAALAKLNHANGSPVRFGYAGAFWHVLPSKLGLHVKVAQSVSAAVGASPGAQLPAPARSIDGAALRAYVSSLGLRYGHTSSTPSVRLVGKHAVVTPTRPRITVDVKGVTAAIKRELTTATRSLIALPVTKTHVAVAPGQRAVVVRLGSQTLTAYLDGKPILTTPVTTGRPALPTPIGSFTVQFRASPYVFHSPWPQGSAYYYPPTPVTWAMEFYNGDFLHDDPGEPSDAFGSDSQNGYFASHGCVHIPHDAMAFLYRWLPVGAPVIVSQN